MKQVVASRRPFGRLVLIGLLLGSVGAQQRIGSTSQPLTIKNVPDWRANGNQMPVCWETPGYTREKGIVQAAVTNTWQWYANVQFSGWGACPTGGIGGSATLKQVRIRIGPQGTDNAGAGGNARYGMTALSSANDNNPGVNLSFNPDGSADRGRVEYVGVHEFGHVLGFVHEQDAPGNVEGPAHCASSGTEANTTTVTPYDRDSIMNYCNRDGNATGNLTDIDIQGVQAIYGVRIRNVAASNSCASAPTRSTASLAGAWNNGGQTSVAVYPSANTKFLYWSQWSNRDGGWGDSVKWFAGDFNGDGRTDIGAAWNNDGRTTLTVRLSTGTSLTHSHWLNDAGRWSNNSAFVSGDFNGDGLSDVAELWNDLGQNSIKVSLSSGANFSAPSAWSVRDGGWIQGGAVKWVVGDFNGDRRSDIGAVWNNGNTNTMTVRRSTGNTFVAAHWSTNAGGWSDTTAWCAGAFR